MSAVSTSAHPTTPSALTRWVTAHPLVTFFVLAYAISWGYCQIVGELTENGEIHAIFVA